MPVTATEFTVDKSDLRKTRIGERPLPDLAPGEILLAIDRFAFTANNITYAELGERMAYWQFFPAADGGQGIIPVWGFADVRESRHDAIGRGERIYGYFPMASHAVLRPERVSDGSFVDASPHRQKLPPAYNLYTRCAKDPIWRPGDEALYALLRPLFVTSFLIDDFLAEENFFGAASIILSSASSKTGFSLAQCIHNRKVVEVVGLTSGGNRAFVSGLGCYDRVIGYDDIARLPKLPAVFVDFAGSSSVRSAVHEHFREDMKYSCAVGMSHRDRDPPGKGLPGARPVFFFAPDRLRKRAEDWGRDGLASRLDEAWESFLPHARRWLTVHHGRRSDAEAVYRATLEGRVPAQDAHVLTLTD